MQKPIEIVGRWVTCVTAVVILLATLSSGDPLLLERTGVLCLVCGSRGGVDVVLNLLLFLPLGVGLGLMGVRTPLALASGFFLSLAVETTQYFLIAGRDPSLSDLLTNSTGTAAGHFIAVNWGWWTSPGRARGLAAGWLVLWLGLLAFGAWGIHPVADTAGAHVMRLPPSEGRYRPHEGFPIETRLGGRFAATGTPAPSQIREIMLTGTISASAVAHAMPPPGKARPLAYVFTNDWQELIVLAQRRRDLRFEVRTRAATVRLQNLEASLAEAFPDESEIGGGFEPRRGPVVHASARRTPRQIELNAEYPGVDAQRIVALSPHLVWTFIAPFGIHYGHYGASITMLWIAAWLAPIAFWARLAMAYEPNRTGQGAAALIMAVVASMLAVPIVAGLPAPSWWQWGAAAGGLASGWAAGAIAMKRVRRETIPCSAGSARADLAP